MENLCALCNKEQSTLVNKVCYNCRKEKRPKYECDRCKQFKPIHRHIGNKSYCQSCSFNFRALRVCDGCSRKSRLVAHNLCGSCYDKWRRNKNQDTGNDYAQMLFEKGKNSPFLIKRFRQHMAKKQRRKYEVQMVIHAQCLYCANKPEHQRAILGLKVDLCPAHYFEKTIGEISERVRDIYPPKEKDELGTD